MTIRVGVHFHGTSGDINPALDRGWQSYLVLDQDRELVSAIARRHPNARVHIRQLAEVCQDPVANAIEAAHYMDEMADAFPRLDLWCSSANEPSQECLRDDMRLEDFARVRDYCWAWVHEFRRQLHSPNRHIIKAGFLAESPGHNEDGPTRTLVGYAAMAQAMMAYDGLYAHLYIPRPQGEHAYWHDLRIFRPPLWKDQTEGGDFGDPGGLYQITRDWRRSDGSKFPIFITETNVYDVPGWPNLPGRVREWLADVAREDVDRRVKDVLWFLWTTEFTNFKQMQMPLRPSLIDAWVDQPHPDLPPPPPGGDMTDQLDYIRDDPAAFERWWTEGGFHHYRRHRQATGALPVPDVGTAIEEAKQDARAIIEQAYRLGKGKP